EFARKHRVLDVEAFRFAGGNAVQVLIAVVLPREVNLLGVEHAQWTELARTPGPPRLDRIVDGRVDVIPNELHCNRAAATVWNVGHLLAGRLFQRDRDDLVFLIGALATHLDLFIAPRFSNRHA